MSVAEAVPAAVGSLCCLPAPSAIPAEAADRIRAPLLLIHGEADDNPGTFPIQSERMYAAVRGNGGTVRYVRLPAEAHGYQALESVEHVVWEMLAWFDRYVKGAATAGSAAH
jgi:dipeptidyl aminopeptidase/acylaminoacyl peptidase